MSPAGYWKTLVVLDVFVPLKDLSRAKSRLRGSLDDDRRRALARAMGFDLLELVARQPVVRRVYAIVGPGWPAQSIRALGANVLHEGELEGEGLNALLENAIGLIKPTRALVLHGDLPLIGADDIAAIDARLGSLDILLCPNEDHSGTNAIGLLRPDSAKFFFGPGSFELHCAQARRSGRSWGTYQAIGTALDLDDSGDLKRLTGAGGTEGPPRARVRRWLAALGASPGDGASAACSPRWLDVLEGAIP